MRKIIALFLALTMLLSLAACGKQEQGIDLSGKLDKLPTKQDEIEAPDSPAVTEPEKPQKTEKPEERRSSQIPNPVRVWMPTTTRRTIPMRARI